MFIYHIWPPMGIYPQATDDCEDYSEALKHLKEIRLEALSGEDELEADYEQS